MNKTTSYKLIKEALWILLSIILSLLIVLPIISVIRNDFILYILVYLFLAINYFRSVLFLRKSIFLQAIGMRIAFFVINIPLFFGIIIQLQEFLYLFDHYDISQFMRPGVYVDGDRALSAYETFRQILIASGVSSLMLIFIMQLRLASFIFKYFRS